MKSFAASSPALLFLLSDRRRLWNSLFLSSVATGSWQINRVMIQSNSWEKIRCSLCCWANLEVYVEDSRAQLQQDCKLPLENNWAQPEYIRKYVVCLLEAVKSSLE